MYHVPLHPRYSFYWESVSIDEVLLLKNQLVTSKQNNDEIVSVNLTYNPELKDILERLGVVHSVENGSIRISNTDQIYALNCLLLESKPYSITDSRTSRSVIEYGFDSSNKQFRAYI